MTELEKKIAAKIPGKDTGIEIKRTMCDICTPLNHCGIDAYVKDGVVIKIEGTKGHPMNDGKLCTKGACNRAYIYREDRIKTPMRRIGPKGSGEFEPISWEEAYDEIAAKMLKIKETYGANSVMFYSGYAKHYRFMLQRMAYQFGSVNYSTESSACFTASRHAWMLNTGKFARPDLMNANLYLAWGSPTHYSRYTNANNMDRFRARGGKVISVDPRVTPFISKGEDLHLRVKPGTDGLLANCIAGIIIKQDKHDKEYIEKYVHGFDAYAEYVCSLDVAEVSKVTTVPEELIYQAADLIASVKPMSIENNITSVIHQTNGLQSVRAIFALSAITGNYNTIGGNFPLDFCFCEQGAGFKTRDEEFAEEKKPQSDVPMVGAERFPVWAKLSSQAQAMDMMRQIHEEAPYPIKCIYAHGMNHRMFPNTEYTLSALEKLDFFVDIDLFMTDTAKLADIVLPACSSFEREEFKVYPGGWAAYYMPAIPAMYESKSDEDIIRDLCRKMNIEDEYLCGGYRKCIEHVIEGTGLSMEEMIQSDLPVKAQMTMKPVPYAYLNKGCDTPTGKIELYSEVIAGIDKKYGLHPLPVYEEPKILPNEEYPFILQTGVRIPNNIHTRLHSVSWARALRPDPMVDMSVEDAKQMGLKKGDMVEIYNNSGSIRVKVNPTTMVSSGQLYMYHGYPEADVAKLFEVDNFDPYSGFPNYKSVICNLKKGEA